MERFSPAVRGDVRSSCGGLPLLRCRCRYSVADVRTDFCFFRQLAGGNPACGMRVDQPECSAQDRVREAGQPSLGRVPFEVALDHFHEQKPSEALDQTRIPHPPRGIHCVLTLAGDRPLVVAPAKAAMGLTACRDVVTEPGRSHRAGHVLSTTHG